MPEWFEEKLYVSFASGRGIFLQDANSHSENFGTSCYFSLSHQNSKNRRTFFKTAPHKWQQNGVFLHFSNGTAGYFLFLNLTELFHNKNNSGMVHMSSAYIDFCGDL